MKHTYSQLTAHLKHCAMRLTEDQSRSADRVQGVEFGKG